jgi:hypothetical protein
MFASGPMRSPNAIVPLNAKVPLDVASSAAAAPIPDMTFTCKETFGLGASATADALLCLTCCCFCGGCCGEYASCTEHVVAASSGRPGQLSKAGDARCKATCAAQCLACVIVPPTLGMCFWFCCGAASWCANRFMDRVTNEEHVGRAGGAGAGAGASTSPDAACAPRSRVMTR